MNDQQRLFVGKMAYFEYTIPFAFFDEAAIRDFYQKWADDNKLVVDMEVHPITDSGSMIRFLARDLKLRVDVANKTPDEIYEIYVALRSFDYVDELEKESKE